jgi:hypothetical protein
MKRFLLAVSLVCFIALAVPVTASAAPGRGQTPFDKMDKNNDNKLSENEFRGPDGIFDKMDADGNGYVTRKEMGEFHQNKDTNQVLSKKPEGSYPVLTVITYNEEKAWPGNVIFVDKNWNRVVEADLKGNIVWECPAPEVEANNNMKGFCGAMLTDVELLPNDNVLILIGGVGVFELDRECKVVWSYLNETVSHDSDRLANGNTIMACAGAEISSEFPYDKPQAIEVNRNGDIVWEWHAKKEYLNSKYKNIRSKDANDWTHLNSVQRLEDGSTLLSVRNWNMIIGVDEKGHTVWETGGNVKKGQGGWPIGTPSCPHTPVMLDNGKIIVSESMNGRAIEWDPKNEKMVWKYPESEWQKGGPYYFVRASHRLPNGNTFIIDSKGMFIEVTKEGEIVWKAKVQGFIESDKPLQKGEINKAPCFNADRRGLGYYGGR